LPRGDVASVEMISSALRLAHQPRPAMDLRCGIASP
jgi:hypothetical protein